MTQLASYCVMNAVHISRVSWLMLACLWGALLPACSSEKNTPDNICAFAEDGNNCWHSIANEVDSCMGSVPSGERGTLNASGTTCTYPSGRTIQFAIPLAVNTDLNDKDVDFTVVVGGKTCLHYATSNNGSNISVTGPDGKVVTELSNSSSGTATVTCPNGSQFSGNGMSLFSCLDASLGGGMPGTYYSWSSSSETLGLLGGETVFDCTNGS